MVLFSWRGVFLGGSELRTCIEGSVHYLKYI